MSKGINLYEEYRPIFGLHHEGKAAESRATPLKPCIFLSHKSDDKDSVKAIGEYIQNAAIDIWLDAEDPELQKAVRERDDVKITEFIERGISFSSDVMVLLSNKTQDSWWVPYEFGFGKKGGKTLASLKLKDVANPPSFIKIVQQLNDITDLNSYLTRVRARTPALEVITETRNRTIYVASISQGKCGTLMDPKAFLHPLAAYIDS